MISGVNIVCQDILKTNYINESAGELENKFNFKNSKTKLCYYNVMKNIYLIQRFVNLRLFIIHLHTDVTNKEMNSIVLNGAIYDSLVVYSLIDKNVPNIFKYLKEKHNITYDF